MLAWPYLDQAHLLIADRLAEADHHALVQLAQASGPTRLSPSRLRLRLAGALRGLACRLDPSPALNA